MSTIKVNYIGYVSLKIKGGIQIFHKDAKWGK